MNGVHFFGSQNILLQVLKDSFDLEGSSTSAYGCCYDPNNAGGEENVWGALRLARRVELPIRRVIPVGTARRTAPSLGPIGRFCTVATACDGTFVRALLMLFLLKVYSVV